MGTHVIIDAVPTSKMGHKGSVDEGSDGIGVKL